MVSFIKKVLIFIVLLAICGYAATAWEAHASFESSGEKLVRQLGTNIVGELGKVSPTCRTGAHIDSVAIQSDWPLAQKGSAVLYISGSHDSAISIEYRVETAGDKVYVQPKDPSSAQLSLMQFGLNGCS
jgi:hypothetical protein